MTASLLVVLTASVSLFSLHAALCCIAAVALILKLTCKQETPVYPINGNFSELKT